MNSKNDNSQKKNGSARLFRHVWGLLPPLCLYCRFLFLIMFLNVIACLWKSKKWYLSPFWVLLVIPNCVTFAWRGLSSSSSSLFPICSENHLFHHHFLSFLKMKRLVSVFEKEKPARWKPSLVSRGWRHRPSSCLLLPSTFHPPLFLFFISCFFILRILPNIFSLNFGLPTHVLVWSSPQCATLHQIEVCAEMAPPRAVSVSKMNCLFQEPNLGKILFMIYF